MKAVIINKFGALEGSIIKTGLDIPRPARNDVLIKVKAAGVNRPDILQRQGLYKIPSDASPIMGLEVAGEIVKVGMDVTKRKQGEYVLGSHRPVSMFFSTEFKCMTRASCRLFLKATA